MDIDRWIITDDGNCFLCREPDADYKTHVCIDDGGHLQVDVHMTCLIEKGSTLWYSATTPQIAGLVKEAITNHSPMISSVLYMQDDVAFINGFPELREEIMATAALLECASNRRVIVSPKTLAGAFIWYGILRPVDYLVAIRKLKGQVESENPWALMAQTSLNLPS